MTPTKEVAPYVTGAGPRSTSIRATSRRLNVEMAGFRAPPHGIPSTTRRKASNSRRPQNSGTALAGPASPPGAIAMPVASARASLREVAPRARRSAPEITSIDADTSWGASGIRVATTSTGGMMTGGCWGAACAANRPGMKMKRPSARSAGLSVGFPDSFIDSLERPGATSSERVEDVMEVRKL